ncbi:MAG TPA: hypothetical protein DIV82_03770 [Brevundimonas diminuta]|nr:hypothetical protein [Brevundimonas diminuta]
MSTTELDTYLLTNWLDLDAAASRGNVIEYAVLDAVADEVRRWAEARQWSGVFTSETLWLAPPEWTVKAGKRPAADAWFRFAYYGPEEDNFAITSLMGLNQDVAGFDFHQDRVAAKLWKQKATTPQTLDALPGFSLQSAVLFHPYQLAHADVLEAASGGDYSHVAGSITTVLDQLEAAVPTLSALLGDRP